MKPLHPAIESALFVLLCAFIFGVIYPL